MTPKTNNMTEANIKPILAVEEIMLKWYDHPEVTTRFTFSEGRILSTMIVEAILTTPGLLWPEGEQWMSDAQVDDLVIHDDDDAPYDIRDLAQVRIDAMEASEQLWRKIATEKTEDLQKAQREITRLRGELKELEQMNHKELEQMNHKVCDMYMSVKSELDKAKERVKELEGLCSSISEKAYYEGSDFGREVYHLTKHINITKP